MIRLFAFLKPYRWQVALVLTLAFLQSLAELYLPTLLADIVNRGVVAEDIAYVWRVGGLMLLVAVLGGLCAVGAGYWSAKSTSGFARDLRSRVFAHAESFSLREFNKLGTASLITRTTNDINQVYQVLTVLMRVLVMAPMMCFGGVVMAMSIDATLAMVIVAIIPVLALFITFVFRKGGPLFRELQLQVDRLNRVLREHLTGVRVIRAFNRTEHEQRRFEEANRDLTGTAIRINRMMAVVMPAMTLTVNFAVLAVVWFGGFRIEAGHLGVGDLMAFIQYAWQIMFSLMFASMMLVMLPRAQASAVRILEVLDTEPTLRDISRDISQDISGNVSRDVFGNVSGERAVPFGSRQDGREANTVEFRRVTFRHPGAEMPALRDVSFVARPGEVTAIIGGTGSGKSTLIQLIPRFFDPDEGQVLVGGVDVREMPLEQLRSRIGFVPQKSILFSGTVAENIRFGKEDATDEEVRRAAEVAQAAPFIEKLEEGYDTHIEQGGVNLSGGQKQRLAIARALVRKPGIYLFDDSFSALDYKTDAKLRQALREETKGATVIIVAQRVSTVMDADRIIVLDNGEVAGIGTHRELLETSKVYREIVASQLSEEEIA